MVRAGLLSVSASTVMHRASRLEQARRLGIAEPLEFARSGLPLPPRVRLIAQRPDPDVDYAIEQEETRAELFVHRCALCGDPALYRYCIAHDWAEGQ